MIEDIVMCSNRPHRDNPFAWETKNSHSQTGEGMATTYLPISKNEESTFPCADVRNGGGVRRTNTPKTKPKGRSGKRREFCGFLDCNAMWEILD